MVGVWVGMGVGIGVGLVVGAIAGALVLQDVRINTTTNARIHFSVDIVPQLDLNYDKQALSIAKKVRLSAYKLMIHQELPKAYKQKAIYFFKSSSTRART
jgi:tetrahydrodipicolinate N-succinyltransferase